MREREKEREILPALLIDFGASPADLTAARQPGGSEKEKVGGQVEKESSAQTHTRLSIRIISIESSGQANLHPPNEETRSAIFFPPSLHF
ncbi:hypothetical protein JZ751_007862 [Albula glossodonta]|uniref:Uncharacterized protein n=1 Tax=Albula glossodonta TaxID=121402 RepID=A0A8T2P2U4_9TELE|nr:hypothetical protein JZ751_007862 [Albula glossodonta]